MTADGDRLLPVGRSDTGASFGGKPMTYWHVSCGKCGRPMRIESIEKPVRPICPVCRIMRKQARQDLAAWIGWAIIVVGGVVGILISYAE